MKDSKQLFGSLGDINIWHKTLKNMKQTWNKHWTMMKPWFFVKKTFVYVQLLMLNFTFLLTFIDLYIKIEFIIKFRIKNRKKKKTLKNIKYGVPLGGPWGPLGRPWRPWARPARILGPLLRGIARALFSCPFLINCLSISPPSLAPCWPPKSKKINENSMSRCFPKLRSIFDWFLLDFWSLLGLMLDPANPSRS